MRIYIADQLRIVRIAPEFSRMFPRQAALDLQTVRQLVEHKSLQVFIVFQDKLVKGMMSGAVKG